MIKKALIKDFNAGTYRATVQIAGSMGVWLEDIPVSRGISAGEMIAGRQCAIIFFDDTNPADGVVAAVYE